MSWGQLATRWRQNLLAGVVSVPEGGLCAAEFLAFDLAERSVLHCRYAESAPTRCRTCAWAPDPESPVKLVNPRVLMLCGPRRLFASLEMSGGSAEVALWQLPRAGDDGFYTLAARVDAEGVAGARALAWADHPSWLARPGCPEAGPAAGTSTEAAGGPAVLAVLLPRDVLLLTVERRPDGSWAARPGDQLHVGFQGSCLCWAANGSQLLVGGSGQMACFAWTAPRGTGPAMARPAARHLLCAGECTEAQAVYADVFLCRLELKAAPADQTLDAAGMVLPGGLRLPPAQDPRGAGRLVVEVENPQDCLAHGPHASAAPGLLSALGGAALGGAAAEAALGLQVVPQRRCLLPLRCEEGTGASPRRVRCGRELEVDGELLAVARGAVEPHDQGLVAAGSFLGSSASVWRLAPPHRWGRSEEWRQVARLDLAGAGGPEDGAAAQLRLRGLALLPGRGVELHGALSVPDASPLGRPCPRELLHSVASVAEELGEPQDGGPGGEPESRGTGGAAPASGGGALAAAEPSGAPPAAAADAGATQLARLAEDVAGIRGEVAQLRAGVEGLRHEFGRAAGALEAIAASLGSGRCPAVDGGGQRLASAPSGG